MTATTAKRARLQVCRAFAFALCLAAGPATAEETPDESLVSPRLMAKTATYQVMSAANDFLFGVLYGGVAAGGILLAASLIAEPALYYTHESLWNAGLARAGTGESDVLAAKTTTYTVANVGRIFATGWLVTGNPWLAAGFVAFNAAGDAAAYALNDVAWASVALPSATSSEPGPLLKSGVEIR